MALMIADQAIFDKNKSSDAILKMNESQGVKVIKGNTLDELATKLQDAYGVYKGTLIKTINDYNTAVGNGSAAQLDVPRVGGHFKVAAGPFYAFPTGVAIYHTFGGLIINEKAQVLDLQRQPIANLYAAPPTAAMLSVPLLLARHSFQLYIDMRKNYLNTVTALVQALEAKDSYTSGHSSRVAQWSIKLAEEMNLPEDRVEFIKYAGILHDQEHNNGYTYQYWN